MIIGIVGFAGSGKGTVADILVDQHDFTKISFADAVKDATSAIFGWPRCLLEGDTNDSRKFRETEDDFWSARMGRNFTPRLAMQLMGTEAGREVFHQNLWVDVVERRIEHMRKHESQDSFVIPDVRFPNEIEAVRRWGGFIVRILRGKEPEWYEAAERANRENETSIMIRLFNHQYDVHYSEWAWIGQQFNYLISNNGTISMLEADIKHMLRVMTGPDIINQVVRN